MPPKRLSEASTSHSSPSAPSKVDKANELVQGNKNHDLPAGTASDSDSSSQSEEEDEFVTVRLEEIRNDVQCPICLGVIRKTRTVMECLHRFCKECIDKAMRLGKNECPSCRVHCASRRSLRDDPNFDALIAALYPDLDKYEEEELTLDGEEKAQNEETVALISETSRRQTEALGKKRTPLTATTSMSSRRQGSKWNLRECKGRRLTEHFEMDDGEDEGATEHEDSSSAEEVEPRRYRRRRGGRTSGPSLGANRCGVAIRDGNNHDYKGKRAIGSTSGGPAAGGMELLGWRRGRSRSNISRPHGRPNIRRVNYLEHSSEYDEMEIGLLISSVDEDKIPSLQQPYLNSSPKASVGELCQYVAMQTCVDASKIEMLLVNDSPPITYTLEGPSESMTFNPGSHMESQLLKNHQTLEEIRVSINEPNLVLAYRLKGQGNDTDET